MNLWSLTHEKIEELLKQKELKEKELSILEQTEVETLWDNDLDNLEEELTKYENMEEEDRLLAQKLNKGKSGGAIPKRRRGGRKRKIILVKNLRIIIVIMIMKIMIQIILH